MATLNRRNELVSTGRHRRKYILKYNWIVYRTANHKPEHVFCILWIFKHASLVLTDKRYRVFMLISDVSLNVASVCMEINWWVDQRLLVYETELY